MISLCAVNISRCRFLNKRKLRYIVRFILKSVGVKNANLSIVFATDSEIKRLNYLYRGKNRYTDVLSFSMREGKRLPKDSSVLGDIVISRDRAKQQAKRFNSSLKKETFLYIIHGILHLAGYDDEKRASKKLMAEQESKILNRLLRKMNA